MGKYYTWRISMKLLKKVFIAFMCVVSLFSATLGLTACSDVRTLELQIQVYDYKNEETKDVVLTVDLYRHLAEKTVDSVIAAAKDGYYDNAVFYKSEGQNNQIMLGDYKVDADNKIVANTILPVIKGEFERNGVVGSDLANKKGAVGLWRSWYASDTTYASSSDARDTGSANWYMPTKEIASYNGWFCLFGLIDLDNLDNKNALDLIIAAFDSSAQRDDYMVYYTGDYNEEADYLTNYGLTQNIVALADYNEMIEDGEIKDLFTAEGNQLRKYNSVKISVPEISASGVVGAKVVKAIVK